MPTRESDAELASGVRLVKSALAAQIATVITLRKLTQQRAADELDLNQPQVSEIMCGKTDRYSIDTLLRLVRRLGYVTEVRFTPIDPQTDPQ